MKDPHETRDWPSVPSRAPESPHFRTNRTVMSPSTTSLPSLSQCPLVSKASSPLPGQPASPGYPGCITNQKGVSEAP